MRTRNEVVERGAVIRSRKGKKAYVDRKVGECFRSKAHGQCSKGDSRSFSHDRLAQGDLYGGQRRQGRSSSPPPNSKAKTDEGEKNPEKTLGNRERSSSDRRSEIPCSYKNCKKTLHVNFGILPCLKTTSLRLDANMDVHVSSDMLRLRRSPARSQRKVVRKDQLHCCWNLHSWFVYLTILVR